MPEVVDVPVRFTEVAAQVATGELGTVTVGVTLLITSTDALAEQPLLSVADTEIQNPYNTYLHKGLPPGPIANPGMKSMEAVLNAPQTDYLFFVADKEGHHHFTKTYEEHMKVVESIYGN